jgi:hypothetical protein
VTPSRTNFLFSLTIFNRGVTGIYQHRAAKHPHRPLGEFDFRDNNRPKLGVSDVMPATMP